MSKEKVWKTIFKFFLSLNILPLSNRKKWKSVDAKSGRYGEYGRISHPDDLIFSAFIENKEDYIFGDNISTN